MFRRILSSMGLMGGGEVSPEGFTNQAAEIFRKEAQERKVEVAGPFELKLISPDGREGTVFLDNLFKSCAADPKQQPMLIAEFARQFLKAETQSEVVLPRSVIPVIKDRAFLEEMRALFARDPKSAAEGEIACEALNSELFILYVADNPQMMKYLRKSDVAQLHLGGESLKSLAVDNLRQLLTNVQSRGGEGFFVFTAGGCYEPSLILLDHIWEKVGKFIQGSILFAAPARDVLFVADSAIPTAVKQLAQAAKEVFRDAPYRVSDRIFVRLRDRIDLYEPGETSLSS